jgi:hypothetical protein
MNLVETSHTDYQSYLLRVWHDEARNIWHASLQNTLTKRVYHFTDAETLLAFLTVPPTAPSTDGERING